MKTNITIAVLAMLFSFLNALSQAPAKRWDAGFGGSENEQFAAGQQTKDGGYMWGGYSESGISGDKSQPGRGSSDYWVVKTDANGVKQWDKRFGGTSVDELTCLQQTTDDGYILGGTSFSGAGADKSQPGQGSSDYWIVKINSNGTKQWDVRFGGSLQDELHSIKQTSDGGYILGGSSISGISGDKTQSSRGGKDFWIVKIDANGTKQWDARFGGDLFEELFSVYQANDGGYILGGYSLSDINGDKTQRSRGRYDFWVVKTDAVGTKQWDAGFGGSDDDWLTQLQQTKDGGYILGGWSWSGATGDKSQPSQGDNDYWAVRIDSLGIKQWDADFGGSSNDYCNAIQQTTDGGYVLGGYSSSPISGDKTQETQGGTDYWMLKMDADGESQWDADFGGNDFDFLYSIQQTTDSGYVLGGYSSSGISGDKTQESKGLNDYWIVKTGAETAACDIPVNLRSAGISSNEVLVKWRTVSEATKYALAYKKATSGEWTIIPAGNSYKKLNGLSADSKYEWKVRSVCSEQPRLLSAWSAKESFTTRATQVQATGESKLTVADKNFSVNVYPNPVSQTATVSFSVIKASTVIITITDVNGALLKAIANAGFSAGDHTIQFNRESLMPGIYFLRVKTSQGITMKKILIE